jgi:hypothetical protein
MIVAISCLLNVATLLSQGGINDLMGYTDTPSMIKSDFYL